MCDYSLEAYKSRPAREGETITTHRFPSGSLGFVAPENATVAVCLACDTQLHLSNLPRSIQTACDQPAKATATFVRLDTSPYRDGVQFDNGKSVTLQQLGTGVSALIVNSLTSDVKRPEPASRQTAEADRPEVRTYEPSHL
ncbi:MAG: hypothetical protein ACR2O4_17230 [Hyphomicrobiaceae bacterium]